MPDPPAKLAMRQTRTAAEAPLTEAPLSNGKRVALLGLTLSLAALFTNPATAQSVKDLLGGSDSPLAPTQQVEPKLSVTITPEGELKPGATLTLAIKAEYGESAYTYSQDPGFGGATKIAVTEIFGLEAIDEQFTPDRKPKVVFEEAFEQNVQKFPGSVTWTRRYRYQDNVPVDQIFLAGNISYQVCDAQNCRPLREDFEVFPELPGDDATMTPATEIAATPPAQSGSDTAASDAPPASANEPAMRAAVTAEEKSDAPFEFNLGSRADEASLPWYLTMAFLGGLILNIMPCVLPVLAIKVMSFVQQAGESRGRVLALNISYSLGVIGVFLALASLAIFPQILGQKLGWGGLFQRPEFNLAMIGIVFAMALSMLGVFEIPIPGMIGSAGGQHREGLLGAFLIGIFATLLATPCSGPLMTTVLAWSVKQEPLIVYLIWGVMGLGMASPFLVVGFVPALAKFIPRPGDWMVRFKEFSGFALLAAVLWLMNSLSAETILPTLIMMLGIGIGLWMIGSMYDHKSSFTRRMTVRTYALLTMGLICWFGFTKYNEAQTIADGELPWETFSGERLMELTREGHPVLIDFTADWCLICKQNEKLALNTTATNEFVRKNGVVTLYADFTRTDPEIQTWLEKFGSISVPLTVIFPKGNPQDFKILDGPYSQSTLLAELEQAVSSNVALENPQSARIETTSR